MKQQPTSPRKAVVARYVVVGLSCGLVALAAPFAADAFSDWSKAREQAALEARYGRLAEHPEALKRVEAIEAEIGASSAPSWAGRYSMGDGLTNITLYIAPKSGFVASWSSDSGGFDADAGTVKAGPYDSLLFSFAHRREAVLPQAVYVPVSWGGRRYLIASVELPAFVHAINLNEVPSVGMGAGRWLVATGGRTGQIEDRQALPSAYAGWVREKAATARVLTISNDDMPDHGPPYFGCAMWDATLAVTGTDALHDGEVLDAQGPDRDMMLLMLGHVDGAKASGRILERYSCDGRSPVPEVGWVFTTGAFDPVAMRRRIADELAQDVALRAQTGKECARHWYRLWMRPDDCTTEQ